MLLQFLFEFSQDVSLPLFFCAGRCGMPAVWAARLGAETGNGRAVECSRIEKSTAGEGARVARSTPTISLYSGTSIAYFLLLLGNGIRTALKTT